MHISGSLPAELAESMHDRASHIAGPDIEEVEQALAEIDHFAGQMVRGKRYFKDRSSNGLPMRRIEYSLRRCEHFEHPDYEQIEADMANPDSDMLKTAAAVTRLREIMLEGCRNEAALFLGYNLEYLRNQYRAITELNS